MLPVQRAENVSGPIAGSGEPVPKSKFTVLSTRVIFVPVKFALSKYSAVSPPLPPATKVAVYVVLAAGDEMACVLAPPSDQALKLYAVPPAVCGETTPSVRVIPTTLGTSAGVVTG